MPTDDLTPLRSLVAVIDSGSIAAAARTLGYSAPAVSRHISGLERELGAALFERTGRAVRPSILARVVGEKARLVLEEADQFDRDIRSLARGDAGVVRLAYFRAVGTTILPTIIANFARSRPNAHLNVIECALSEDVVALLQSGEADAGFVWGFTDAEAPGLATTALISEALVLLSAADREDLHEDPTDLSRLVDEPFSSVPGHKGSPPIVDQMFLARGLTPPTVTHRLSDHAMSKSLLAAGVIVSLIPALGISDATPGVLRSVVVADFRRSYLARDAQNKHPLMPALEGVILDAVRSYRGFGVDRLV